MNQRPPFPQQALPPDPRVTGFAPQAPTAERVGTPFGGLYGSIVPETSVTMWTREGNKLPDQAMYAPDRSPQRPFTFDVVTYTVPTSTCLLLMGYHTAADRVGGVGAFDTQPLEPGRMRQSWIWDLVVDGNHVGRDTQFEIIPTPIVQLGAGTGLPQLALQNAYASTTARQAQSIGGAGLAGLPFQDGMYGPEGRPFSILVKQRRTVALRCSVIRALSTPLAGIRGRLDGYLFPVSLLPQFGLAVDPG